MAECKRERVVVGMSGGVDSSVAVLLLKRRFNVLGVTLKISSGLRPGSSKRECGNLQALVRAQRTADELDVPLEIVDCSGSFQQRVLHQCWRLFEQGSTPNPCYICNYAVKFAELIRVADRVGARMIATGHYARTGRDAQGRCLLKRGVDPDKEQSYFLAGLTQNILERIIFPLGEMRKDEVRRLAAENALASAALRESQDLCFTGEQGDFADSLCRKFSGSRVCGVFIDEEGRVLRHHTGIHRYTIGQRRGLNFATGSRVKITAIDPRSGAITVSADERAARSSCCKASAFTWHCNRPRVGTTLDAQVRYRQHPIRAVITAIENDSVELHFETPVLGVTPGQALVLYSGDCVVGSGFITP
jgi:tRNA-uridine 2-sulfurtransferase